MKEFDVQCKSKFTSLFGNFQDEKEGVSDAALHKETWDLGESNIIGVEGWI
jgi:hypothetical protein